MQCCMAGLDINYFSKFLTTLPQENSNCIIAKYKHVARNVLPLSLQGATSVLNVLKITESEWTPGESSRIFLTDKNLHWEPNSSIFEDQEHACTDVIGDLLPRPNSPGGQPLIINQVTLSTTVDAADLTANDNFASFLKANEHVTVSQLSRLPTNNATVSEISNSTNRYETIQSNKRKQIDGDTLARRWLISSDKDRVTVKNTTQQGIRSVLNPTLSH